MRCGTAVRRARVVSLTPECVARMTPAIEAPVSRMTPAMKRKTARMCAPTLPMAFVLP